MLSDKSICFIGAGAMAEAMIKGLLTQQLVKAGQLAAVDIAAARLQLLQETYGVRAGGADAAPACLGGAEVIVLAVKPNQLAAAVADYGGCFRSGQLLISVVAGASLAALRARLPAGVSLVRAMPNTSAAVGLSATAICSEADTESICLDWAEALFRSVGSVVRVPEAFMDAVTALAGSGPAYVYSLAEAMELGGVAAGLDAETARELTVQTLLGAAHMLDSQGKAPAELRRRVTSPGGTTMAGLEVLQSAHFTEILRQAILSAADRSRSLAQQTAAATD